MQMGDISHRKKVKDDSLSPFLRSDLILSLKNLACIRCAPPIRLGWYRGLKISGGQIFIICNFSGIFAL